MSKKTAAEFYSPATQAAIQEAYEVEQGGSGVRRRLNFGNELSASAGVSTPDADMHEAPTTSTSRQYNEPFFWETRRKSFRPRRYFRSVYSSQRRRPSIVRRTKKRFSLSAAKALIKKYSRK